MSYYETVFIARQDLAESQVENLLKEVQTIVSDEKGQIYHTEKWGLRTLAYKINKNRRGHYVLVRYEGDGKVANELERRLRLHDDVLRSLTLRQDEKSTEPSVMTSGNDDKSADKSSKKEAA